MSRTLPVLFVALFFAGPSSSMNAVENGESSVALATELLELTQMDRMLSPMLEQIDAMMVALAEEASSCAAVKPVVEEFSKAQSELLARIFESGGFVSAIGAVYVEVFDEDELRELVEFYRSPLGQKLIDRMPTLMQRSMAIGQEVAQAAMPQIQRLSEQYTERLGQAQAQCSADTTDG